VVPPVPRIHESGAGEVGTESDEGSSWFQRSLPRFFRSPRYW
jgi:hypothetical protein